MGYHIDQLRNLIKLLPDSKEPGVFAKSNQIVFANAKYKVWGHNKLVAEGSYDSVRAKIEEQIALHEM